MMDLAHHVADVGEVRLHYVAAGTGEPVVLLHGWPTTWYEWRKVIPLLAERHHVIAPDLRGLGDSSRPSTGYDKRTVANDVWRLVRDVLGHERFCLAGHDWGGPTAYALAAAHPDAVRRLAIIDVAPPHDGAPWGPAWHHLFHDVPDLPEALVRGREDVYLGWFRTQLAHPSFALPDAAMSEYLRTYTQPGAMRAGFEYYRAIAQDTADNTALSRDSVLPMPVLAIHAAGPWSGAPHATATSNHTADSMAMLARDVTPLLIEGSGHWIPEEQPELLASSLIEFFAR